MRVAPAITLAPPSSSVRPRPNSMSAPVDGVVVLAPSTPVDGSDAEFDELETVDVEDEGSVTTVVSALDDWLLVDCVDTVSLDVVVGVLLVDEVLLVLLVDGDDVVSFDEVVVCEDEDVVVGVLLVVLCVLLVDDVVLELLVEPPAQVLERTRSPLPFESSAPVPSASAVSFMIPDSGTHAQVRVAPPSASTTTALYPPSFPCWTYVTVSSVSAPLKLAAKPVPFNSKPSASGTTKCQYESLVTRESTLRSPAMAEQPPLSPELGTADGWTHS